MRETKNDCSLILEMDILDDIEPLESYRFTIGQFMQLNPGTGKLNRELVDIFDGYTMPACCRVKPYNNRLNTRFYEHGAKKAEGPKRRTRKFKEDAFSDSNILSTMRHAFGSVAKGSGRTAYAIAAVNQILIPETMVEEVARLFFDTIIQSPKQMPEYLDVLFGTTNAAASAIQFQFVKITCDVFKNPLELESTALESKGTRTRKHREATCSLNAALYIYNFTEEPQYRKPRNFFRSVKNLREKLLDPLFINVNIACPRDQATNYLKDLANVWQILNRGGRVSDLVDYQERLVELYHNERYKLTGRLLLRDYVE